MRIKKVAKYIKSNSSVVDIGCGDGNAFIILYNKLKQGFGFDLNTRNITNGRISIKSWDVANGIPLNTKSVDYVLILAVLEHLKKPEIVLKESYRILKFGGSLILTTPTPLNKPVLEFLSFKLNLIDKNYIRQHEHYFLKSELKKMAEKNGFTNIKSKVFQLGLNRLTICGKMSEHKNKKTRSFSYINKLRGHEGLIPTLKELEKF